MNKKLIFGVLIVIAVIVGLVIYNKKEDAGTVSPDTTTSPVSPTATTTTPAVVTPSTGPAAAPVFGTWTWTTTSMTDGTTVTPKKAAAFAVTFTDDGKVSGKTDCNGFRGTYAQPAPGKIGFGPLASTLMFCEGSQENIFTGALAKVTGYSVSIVSGTLELTFPGGVMHFKK